MGSNWVKNQEKSKHEGDCMFEGEPVGTNRIVYEIGSGFYDIAEDVQRIAKIRGGIGDLQVYVDSSGTDRVICVMADISKSGLKMTEEEIEKFRDKFIIFFAEESSLNLV